MKKFMLILFLITATNYSFSQGSGSWQPKIHTYIPYVGESTANERVAIFANHNGVHVLKVLHETNDKHAIYFRLTSTGQKPDGFPPQGISLDSHGDFPNVVGDENIIYAVYRKDNAIQIKTSTNGGDNWNTIDPINFINGNVLCNGVDAAYTIQNGLHVVWSEKVGSDYESYFNRYVILGGWIGTENITETSPVNNGGFPTITTSLYNGQHNAHVTLNTGNGDDLFLNHGQIYSREYNYINWSTPINIQPIGQESHIDRLLYTDDGYLHCFYYKSNVPFPADFMY
ncbi:MAG: hypothetical protein R3321_06670, partial [Nitrososphaeraceae archaeon]|nr:hypothetical protein [Nitrososphaeraceae archaeon]